ncbi:S-adenosyl-L-methionine-dependent methyltransferase [Sparassis latifolia]
MFSTLITSAWSTVQRSVLDTTSAICKTPLCNIAEVAVVSLLKNITHGCLVIHTPSRTYTFPSPSDTRTTGEHSLKDSLKAELTVCSPVFWLRLCATGDLGFSEAYMYGEVDCDNLINVFLVFLANRDCLSAIDTPLARLLRVPQRFASARLANSVANARSNISAHYDISNDMFQGFLSKDMTYSCAIFPDLDGDLCPTVDSPRFVCDTTPDPSDIFPALSPSGALPSPPISPDPSSDTDTGVSTPSTLAELADQNQMCTQPDGRGGAPGPACANTSPRGAMAQMNEGEDALHAAQMCKLRHIVRKADIRPGHRVLEIGSGWCALAIHIASSVPGTTVDTITLSVQQVALARERVRAVGLGPSGNEDEGEQGRVRVHLMDYRSMPAEWEGAFDRVVSVEMVENVGQEYLETYWAKIDWALRKDTGVGVVQSITIPEARFDAYTRDTDFIRKWVLFPGGLLPSFTLLIETLTRGTCGRLIVDSVSNIGPHYARTLREWRLRFEAHFEDVVVPALKREHPRMVGADADDASVREEIEVFRRKWLYYFCYCEVGFTARILGDHIITFTREGNVEYRYQVFA